MQKSKLQFKNQKFNKLLGFTLVELLVVIGIMTVIISILMPNFLGARLRARDAQRKSDLSQIQKGLELYKLDQNPQAYPTSLPVCGGCFTEAGISPTCAAGKNLYMRKVPCDPGSLAATPYIYEIDATDNLKFNLSSCLENMVDSERDPTPVLPGCSLSQTSYTIHEP